MTDHPEYELIKTIIDGDLAGVDEDNWQQYTDALKQLSEDGKLELERARAEVKIELDRYDILYYMPSNSTMH